MEITNTTIEVNRGNRLIFNFQVMNGDEVYTFDGTENITFAIYNKEALDKEPLIKKDFTPEQDTTSIDIELTTEETRLGTLTNQPTIYWYEITLNNETVLGYDRNGAKLFVLYPEGSVGNDTNDNGENNEG